MIAYKEVFTLAQEKGYKYHITSNAYATLKLNDYRFLEATLIQKWLRDEHNLHVYIDTTPDFDKTQGSKYKASVKVPFRPFKWTTGKYYLGDSYEQALLEGCKAALELL